VEGELRTVETGGKGDGGAIANTVVSLEVVAVLSLKAE
jgi:hypothetical protein